MLIDTLTLTVAVVAVSSWKTLGFLTASCVDASQLQCQGPQKPYHTHVMTVT